MGLLSPETEGQGLNLINREQIDHRSFGADGPISADLTNYQKISAVISTMINDHTAKLDPVTEISTYLFLNR